MTISTSLKRELADANCRLLVALRLNRRMTKPNTEHSGNDSLPTALECRRLIEDRTEEYLAALTRYRLALEKVIPKRRELVAPRRSASSRHAVGLHAGGVR